MKKPHYHHIDSSSLRLLEIERILGHSSNYMLYEQEMAYKVGDKVTIGTIDGEKIKLLKPVMLSGSYSLDELVYLERNGKLDLQLVTLLTSFDRLLRHFARKLNTDYSTAYCLAFFPLPKIENSVILKNSNDVFIRLVSRFAEMDENFKLEFLIGVL